jgi:hypothetical protein
MRCADFYKKWKRNPNWCHKCESAVKEINSYIDLADGLEKQGIPQETVFNGLSQWAARPLIAIQDEEIKEKALSSISNALESGKSPITGQFTNKPLDANTVIQVIEKVTTGSVHFSSETDRKLPPAKKIIRKRI